MDEHTMTDTVPDVPGSGGTGAGVAAGPRDGDGRPLSLHRLVYLEEDDGEVTVGRPDIDSYVILPADGAALLRELERGTPPAAAARWYQRCYGEPVDVAEFIEGLREVGFVADPGAGGARATATPPVRWVRLGRAVFSPVAWTGYALLVLACVVAMVREPALLPQYRHLFVTRYMALLEIVVFVGQLPLLLFHEASHALAGRRLGLRSTLSVGRRLYFLVFETSLDGLVAVERRRRFLPILAGMLADLLAFAALTLAGALTLHASGWPAAAGRVALALAFTTLLRLLWQFFFYLRTDLYFVVVTVLGCVDLHKVAFGTLRNRVNRRLGRRHALLEESGWHPRDRAVARWYSWLLLAGYAVSLATLASQVVPAAAHILAVAVGRFLGTEPVSAAGLADSVAFVAVNLLQVVLIVALGRRERRQATAYRHVLS